MESSVVSLYTMLEDVLKFWISSVKNYDSHDVREECSEHVSHHF